MNRQIKLAAGNPMALGVNKAEDGYNFAVVSQEEKIALNLYHKGAQEPYRVFELDEHYKFGDIFAIRISGLDFDKLEYNYTIAGRNVLDPYCKQICDTYEFGKSIRESNYRSKVSIDYFEWDGDVCPKTSYSDTIIYKLHVRGFTKRASSKVKNKGTYQGVIEKIPYFRELGITAVELMPVFEFEEVQKWTENDKNSLYNPQFNGKVNYWGFCRGMYFAPKSAYASCGHKNGDYTIEFKQMVKALHSENIEVIVEMFFPYDTGVNLIRDCIRYWIVEYHIDGFHLNCSNTALEVLANDPLLSRVKMFTDYWDKTAGKKTYKHLANYNQGFMNCARKLLKGDENQLSEFVMRLKSNDADYGTINFLANNNGFTLMDTVSYDRKHNEVNGENNHDGEDFNNSWNCGMEGKCRKKKIIELRKKQIFNAFIMLFLSQGTPLIMAGDEFGNSQQGNNNPYCQDNEITWLNWKNLDNHKDIFEFVKMLISFRKRHGILHMETALRDMDYKAIGYPDVSYHSDNAWYESFENYNRHFGIMYCGEYAEPEDDYIYVAYNLHWEKHRLALPTLPENFKWQIEFTSAGNSGAALTDERTVEVNERSIAVLLGRINESKITKTAAVRELGLS